VNLFKRCLVAAVGIPAIYFLIRLGSWYLLLFVAAQAALANAEFYSMARCKMHQPLAGLGIFLATLLPVVTFLALTYSHPLWLAVAGPASLMLVATAALLGVKDTQGAISRISVTGFGVLYIGGLLSFQIMLRSGPVYQNNGGADWLLLVYLVTWSADVGSYFCGKLFGKHKLSPVLSPGKTWEGVLGGVLFGVAVSWLFGSELAGLYPPGHALFYGVLIGVFAPVGDLVISIFKRDAGVKDSSRLIPGHGGMLDRFDSLLFTAPLTFVYRCLIHQVQWLR